MPLLSLSALTKTFGTTRAVDAVSLDLDDGEIHALIGPSGCGKSTLLRLISGFETPDCGTITMRGQPITTLAPEARDIGIVFQDYALFPHLTVEANIGFGLNRLPRAERVALVREHMAMLQLDGLEKRYPAELSGGQQQRVALARSLAARPGLLLLDEPFSNLDASLREAARRDIRTLLKGSGIAILFVTHDREEALSFADRITVLKAGRLEQSGPPEEVYARPQNSFVAGFLGAANILPGTASGQTAQTVLGEVMLAAQAHGPLTLCLRPETLELCAAETGRPAFRVVERIFRGYAVSFLVQAEDGTRVQVLSGISADARAETRVGEHVGLMARAPAVILQE
ncbi:ABC transporter ATP-binding protein [Xanthobacter sp. TB0136]|uniref:ABC transporter ATP-binding protein n=1 Tax=Xanthobacter sp. TB0136 TaxID=3459177 RepID=UPI00403A4A95